MYQGMCGRAQIQVFPEMLYQLMQAIFIPENQRPKIQLRNRGKIKFKVPYTTLTKVHNSPFYKGAKL